MAELEFSVDSVADIDAIAAFSFDRFGQAVADAYLTGLKTACEQLRFYPEMAAIYPRIRPTMRCLIYRRHRVFYRTDGVKVLVVLILHHAQDVERATS